MEFKYRDDQNKRTPSPTPFSLPNVARMNSDICGRLLQGCEVVPSGFCSNFPALRVFPTPIPVNVNQAFQRELEKEKIQRELEKEEIRREIIANEMARRRELEEEVRREIIAERALGIPMQRPGMSSFREPISLSSNPRMKSLNRVNIFCGPQPQLSPQVDIKQPSTQTNKDQAKSDVDHYGAKRKVVIPTVVDNDSENSPFSLHKKPKQEWRCTLCQITATSEKGLNDHLHGKKHKAKEVSLRTQQIGVDARLDSQTLQTCITTADKSILESRIEDQAVQESKSLGGLENKNETTTGNVEETSALTTRKKFKYYCAFCQFETCSEIVSQSHKNGKEHLISIKKFSQNNGGGSIFG